MSNSGLPKVPNYLTASILMTIFCCLPFGIVAIIKSTQVNSRLLLGDYQGAVAASEQAKKWCWISFIVGLITTVLYILAVSANS